MDIVDFEEMGIIEGQTGFIANIADTSQIVYQDGSIPINQDLGTYGNGITYVTLPNLIQVVEDGDPENVNYLLNNNEVPVLNGTIVLNADALVEISKGHNSEIQQEFTTFLAPPLLPPVINTIKLEDSELNSSYITKFEKKSSLRSQCPPSDRPIYLTCEPCNLRFASWKMYKKHKWKHIDEKPHKCSVCCKGFNYECNLKLHMATHNVDNPYCPVCKRKFGRIAGLKAHIMLHQREESLFCNECGDEFNSHESLKKHMNAEHRAEEKEVDPLEVFPCQRCDQVYATKADRNQHILAVHNILENKKSKKLKNKRKRFNRCDMCNKCFDKPSQLERHKRIHTGERPFECSICKRGFNQKGSLQIHMLKHTKEKPFVCEHCNASFSQKGNLQAHIKRLHPPSNNEERNFRCQMCPCIFKKLGSLNAHFAKVHVDCVPCADPNSQGGSEPHPNNSSENVDSSNKENENAERKLERLVCSYCSAEFRKAGELFKHVKVHTDEKTYKCITCSKSFSLQSDLALHMEEIHSEEKKFSCSYCDLTFSTVQSLRSHQKSHTVPNNEEEIEELMAAAQQSITNDSGSSSNNNIILTENGNIVDMTGDIGVKILRKEKTYKCIDCNLVFKQKIHHRAHMRMHKLSYNCEFCPRTFNSKNTLQVHLKEHVVHKYICEECKKEFSSESALKEHEEIHVTGFNWSCPVCSSVFSSFLLCKNHILSGHPKMSKMTPLKENKILEVEERTKEDGAGDIRDVIVSVLQPNQVYLIGNADGSISITPVPTKETDNSIAIDGFQNPSPSNTQQLQTNPDPASVFRLVPQVGDAGVVNIADTNTILPQSEQFNRCSECNIVFATAGDLYMHKRFATAEECQKPDDSQYYVQELFQCSICSQTFQTEEQCKEHVEKCPGPSENCGEGKKMRSNWRQPARILTEEEAKALSAIEPENAATISEQVLLKSLREKDKLLKSQEEESKREVVVHAHKCKYCPKSFKKPSDLVRHIRTHTGERPYECTSCNKRFSIKTTADSHMKTHSKQKAFECYVCKKPFSTIGSLKVHMRLHTGLKPFSCPLCDAKFRTSGHRKAHLIKHSKEKSSKNYSNKNISVDEINDICLESQNLIVESEENLEDANCVVDKTGYLVSMSVGDNCNKDVLTCREEYFSPSTGSNLVVEKDKNDSSILLNINDEADECPKYFLSIKDGNTPEDGFLVETLNENEIVVTITKGNGLLEQTAKEKDVFLIESHEERECHTCGQCKKLFASQVQLDKHLKKCQSNKLYECSVCFDKFASKGDLELHCLGHELEEVFSSSGCGET